MSGETVRLATYAAGLRFADLPEAAVQRARDCLIDTIAACLYGQDLPWSRIAVAQATAAGGQGRCRILGAGSLATAEAAAFANGVLAHASELDSLCHPGAGVHPGAILVPAALAAAQERGAGGQALLAAIVAGAETLIRVGRATRHSAESRGFHAPGLTGPFGAAAAAGHLFGLDAERMANAFGIAGSLGGGLLEFAASQDGGMVKRLHLGRAAEAGIIAARLAARGFTGPRTVLEGRLGFLNAYCAETEPAALTAGLGECFEILSLCLKRYPCHITAHTPVEAIRAMRADGLTADAVASVTVRGSAKMPAMHADRDPRDLVLAQYSIPFCVAVALRHDPDDPDSFGEASLHDPEIRRLAGLVRIEAGGGPGWATATTVMTTDGRSLCRPVADFPGMPSRPVDAAGMAAKFTALTRRLGPAAATLLARLRRIENETELGWLGAAPAHAGAGLEEIPA